MVQPLKASKRVHCKPYALQWRHNGLDGVSNHRFTQPFIQAQIKESNWSLWGNSPVTDEFPACGKWFHQMTPSLVEWAHSIHFQQHLPNPHRLWSHFAIHTLLKMCSIVWGYTKCFAQSVLERQPFGPRVENSSGSMKRECLFYDICLNLIFTLAVVICKTSGTTIDTNFVKMATYSFYRCKLTYRCPSKGLE